MRVYLLLFLIIITGCARIEGLRDKSYTVNSLNARISESIAIAPIKEIPAMPGLAELIEVSLVKSINTYIPAVKVIDVGSFKSHISESNLIDEYGQWKAAYDSSKILSAGPLKTFSAAVQARYFLLVASVNLSRESMRAVDTGYSGLARNYGNVWRTDLKVLAEVVDSESGKVVWKGVGHAENIHSIVGDRDFFFVIIQDKNPEVKKYISPMIQMATDGIASRINSDKTFEDGIAKEVAYDKSRASPLLRGKDEPVADEAIDDKSSQKPATQNLSARPAYSNKAKKVSEYWCWGLGIGVKTEKSTTVTEFIEDSRSTAKNLLQIGDEIIRIGKIDIVSTNTYKILTKELPTEKDGLVTVVVRRDGKDIKYQIRPNKFSGRLR